MVRLSLWLKHIVDSSDFSYHIALSSIQVMLSVPRLQGGFFMARTVFISAVSLFSLLIFSADSYGEFIRGAATLSNVSSVIKINREGNGLDSLITGEILYVFTESGEPVSQIIVRDIFSDVIHSEPLPAAVARRIREDRSILIFSNLREYGDFIIAFRAGTLDAFSGFIGRYPDSELREEAKRIYDGLVYRPFKISGTPEALDDFVSKHPRNYYVESAIQRRDDLLYMPVRATDRISRYRWFISTYPDNRNAAQAREKINTILSTYESARLEDIAKYPRSHLWKKVKFSSTLHSALPIYVEGPSVGRKTVLFQSPRNASEYLNFQVSGNGFVLWRLFANREDVFIVNSIEKAEKGDHLLVYGTVFTNLGGAPWIDVDDVETY